MQKIYLIDYLAEVRDNRNYFHRLFSYHSLLGSSEIGNSYEIFLWRKEWNVLFNDALNTFYLWLYGIRHMVKDHSVNEWGNLLPPHGLNFLISSKGSFIYIIHWQDNTYHSLCYTSCGALAGTRNSSMGPPWGIDPAIHRYIWLLIRSLRPKIHLFLWLLLIM